MTVDLAGSLNYDALKPLLNNKDFMDKVKEHLPKTLDASGNPVAVPASQTPEELASTVSSPQFQQALSIFSQAMASGQLGPLMSQFNLNQECVEAANRGDMTAFVKALEKSQKKDSSAGSPSKKPDDDHEMALD